MLVVEQMDVDETTDKVELDTWYRQEVRDHFPLCLSHLTLVF